MLPQSLQQRAIDIAHATHLGLSKTKALIREKAWFPKMDEMIKTTIDQCIPCQAVGKSNPPQPIESTVFPWEKLHMDFYGPLPSGDYFPGGKLCKDVGDKARIIHTSMAQRQCRG